MIILVYDFTCSPITTPAYTRKLLGAYNNADRMLESDYAKKNFAKISITRRKGAELLKLKCLVWGGKLKRTLTIPASELKKNKKPIQNA